MRGFLLTVSAGLYLALLSGCVEERVVAVRGGLQNMPGAVGGIRPDRSRSEDLPAGTSDRWGRYLAAYGDPHAQLTGSESDPRRHIDEFGNVTLILRSPADVLYHSYWTIQRGEWELLYDQVVSDRLKRNYVEHFKEPEESVRFLRRNRQDVLQLLELLPGAEMTPGALLSTVGPLAFRITASPEQTFGKRFTSVDVIIEDGVFRLLLIK